jgi:hypothetical protein
MRHHPLLRSLWALGPFAFAACGDVTTQPTGPGESALPAPELAVTPNSWLTRGDMWSTERYDLATAVVPNAAGQSILYAIGGRSAAGGALSKVMAYNVATNTWILRAPLPRPLYGTNGAEVINGKIYVSGGCLEVDCIGYTGPSSALYVYDPRANTWTRKRDMPAIGAWGATGVIGGKLYVLTMCVEGVPSSNYFDTCAPAKFFRYDRLTDRWSTLARPTGAQDFAVGGVIDGKFYVTGYQGQLEVYDPASNGWTTKAPLPNAGVRRAAGAVLRGQLFVVGGERLNDTGTVALRRTIAYDPVADAWTSRAALPTPRVGLGASRVFLDGEPRLQVVGGNRPGNSLQYVP